MIKSMALSKFVYLVSAIGIPDKILKEINKELFCFLWKYKRDKIARHVLINSIDNGGLNMIDLKSYCSAMKAVWAQRLYNATNETWAIIPQKYFETCDISLIMCMNADKGKHIPINLPQFYKEVITSWHECGGGKKAPQSAADIRKEIIWGNKYIQCKGKTLFFRHWKNSNINFIDDLLDENGNFKTGKDIFEKLKSTANWIAEYQKIINAIPGHWKEKRKSGPKHTKVKKVIIPFLTDTKQIFDLPYKAKGYYSLLIKKVQKRTYIEKHWNSIFPDKAEWSHIYLQRIKNQTNKKLADFHYKLIHKILLNQENLFQWKISPSKKCRFGCNVTENYNHQFVECSHLQGLIQLIEKIFASLKYSIKLTYKTLIFGYKIKYPAYKLVNQLISHLFHAIYIYWLKMDNTINIKRLVYNHLHKLQSVHEYTKEKHMCKFIDEFLHEWRSQEYQ